MKLSKVLKHLKRPKVRGSAESALVASIAVPNSGFTFVKNSQGASAAIVELSKSLGTALDEIELDGELSNQLKLELGRLDRAASNYSNSSLSEPFTQSPWACSLTEAQTISIAWKCAAAAYEEGCVPETENMTFEVLKYIKPSAGGSVKIASVTLVEQSSSLPAKNPYLPVLVIAVRGSKSTVDFMVNANCEIEDTENLFDINDLLPQTNSTHSIRAHAGFLNGAAALVKYIDSLVINSKAKHVLFTGHSAGGAVASLLFLKYLSKARKTASSQSFSCITFGSPPVIQPNINQILPRNRQNAPNLGLALAIVNEYDLVSQADQPYLRSLVDLYRSLFQLPPIKDDESAETGKTPSPAQEGPGQEASRPQEAKRPWDLPAPEFWLVGEVVLLRTEIIEVQVDDGQDKPTMDMERALKIFTVDSEEFAKLLFCRISVHRRNEYHKRVDLIENGQFNAQNGW